MAAQDVKRFVERQDMLKKEIRSWLRVNRRKLQQRIASLTLTERARIATDPRLKDSLKSSSKTKNGFIERVAFTFARHGIFLEHGVGAGRPVGSAKAKKYAKPWLRPVLSESIDDLADILVNEYADVVEDFIFAQIPGIINFENGK